MGRNDWRLVLHAANAVALLAQLQLCPRDQSGVRCSMHLAVALGIELLHAGDALNGA